MTVWLRLVGKSALKAQMCCVSTGTFTMLILAFGLGLPKHWKTPPVVHQCTNMHAADLHHHHPLTLLLAHWTNAQQIGFLHQERWRENEVRYFKHLTHGLNDWTHLQTIHFSFSPLKRSFHQGIISSHECTINTPFCLCLLLKLRWW